MPHCQARPRTDEHAQAERDRRAAYMKSIEQRGEQHAQ
jgi:hypothetical protein